MSFKFNFFTIFYRKARLDFDFRKIRTCFLLFLRLYAQPHFRTRYLQAYSSFLAAVEKDKRDARMEGLAEGIEKGIAEGKAHGIEHGKKMMIISLIKDGLLSKEEGAKRLSISVIELDEYMSAEE